MGRDGTMGGILHRHLEVYLRGGRFRRLLIIIIGFQVTARARGHAAGQLHLRGACDPGGGTREKTQSCQVARSVPVTAIAVSPPEARQTSSGQEVGAKRPREKVWGISGVGRGREGPA